MTGQLKEYRAPAVPKDQNDKTMASSDATKVIFELQDSNLCLHEHSKDHDGPFINHTQPAHVKTGLPIRAFEFDPFMSSVWNQPAGSFAAEDPPESEGKRERYTRRRLVKVPRRKHLLLHLLGVIHLSTVPCIVIKYPDRPIVRTDNTLSPRRRGVDVHSAKGIMWGLRTLTQDLKLLANGPL
jgi:hypothetical protein